MKGDPHFFNILSLMLSMPLNSDLCKNESGKTEVDISKIDVYVYI